MKFEVRQKKFVVLSVYASFGLFLFPVGFLWFATKHDRLPPIPLCGVLLSIVGIVIGSLFYLTYPISEGWYNAVLLGGLFTGFFIFSRGVPSAHLTGRRMKAFKAWFYVVGVAGILLLCSLYLLRIKLLGLKFSYVAPAIFVGAPMLWAWLVGYIREHYPPRFVAS